MVAPVREQRTRSSLLRILRSSRALVPRALPIVGRLDEEELLSTAPTQTPLVAVGLAGSRSGARRSHHAEEPRAGLGFVECGQPGMSAKSGPGASGLVME